MSHVRPRPSSNSTCAARGRPPPLGTLLFTSLYTPRSTPHACTHSPLHSTCLHNSYDVPKGNLLQRYLQACEKHEVVAASGIASKVPGSILPSSLMAACAM